MARMLNGKVWGIVRGISTTLWRTIRVKDIWQEVHVSPGVRPEPTLRRFSYFRGRGIRCRLRNLASPNSRFGYTGMVSLRVHKDDLNMAYRLLLELKDS